jgi:DNA polymerase-3 subunit delta'
MARAPALQEIEEIPEADRLDGAPHPRMTLSLIGHAGAERTLAEALASGRIHHGWILAGPRGIGKATLAYRFAAHALALPTERDPFAASLAIDPATTAARQVRALSHPGLLVIRRPYDQQKKRFAATIPVDEVRRIKSFLGHRGADGAWRVVIVDTVDELNVNAANALLKSLEEPPERTLFLLISAEPGRLLATIRSRCRRLDLAPLGDDDLERAVRQAKGGEADMPAGAEWARLARLAEGSVRRALTLEATGGLALFERIERLLAGLPGVDWPAAHTLAEELSAAQAEDRFELFFELLLDRLAALVRAATGGAIAAAEDARIASGLIGPERLASFAELWETVAREKAETLALNLDRKALILSTVSRLETAARPAPAA